MRVVDIHTHGIGGYSTRTTNPDDILKMAQIHGEYGATDIVPTIYSGTITTMRENLSAVKEAIKRQRSWGIERGVKRKDSGSFNSTHDTRPACLKLLPPEHCYCGRRASSAGRNSKLGSIAGVHLEGPFLNPSKSGSLDGTSFQEPSVKTWIKLLDGFEDIVKIVTIAPELEGSLQLIKTMSNMGIIVALGHSDATYQETEKAFHAGAKGITHLFNAMRGLHHRDPGIAGFGLMNPDIYVDLIADPFHINIRVIELIFKVKKPEKIIIISDSVKGTAATKKNHAIDDDNGTLQGGSMTITESAERLIGLGFPKKVVMACISNNPRAYLVPN
jgi:N-acetylglucosamine-6-phosphate deacetylase